MIETLYNAATERAKQSLSPYSYPGISVDNRIELFDDCLCRLFGIETGDLTSKRRHKDKVYAKHMGRYILKNLGWKEIEVAMWNECDRTTVIASCKVAEALITTDKTYKGKYDYLTGKIEKKLIRLPEL